MSFLSFAWRRFRKETPFAFPNIGRARPGKTAFAVILTGYKIQSDVPFAYSSCSEYGGLIGRIARAEQPHILDIAQGMR